MNARLRRALVLAAITAGALWIRLSAIDWMLPHTLEGDYIVFSTQVDRLERDVPHPEQHPKFGYYPLLIARLTVLAFDPVPADPPPRDLPEMLERASAPRLHLRIVVAILSVLIVPATYLLARRFVPEGAALVAAALMAASPLHLWFAQQARPHAASAALTLLAVVAALRLRRNGRVVDYVIAGIALAFALGSLQNGGMAVLSVFAAVCLRGEGSARASRLWSLATLAITALGAWFFYPYLFMKSQGKDAAQFGVEGSVLNLSGHIVFLDQFAGRGWRHVAAALWGFEPWLTVLAAAGAVLALASFSRAPASRRASTARDLAVVLAAVVPYLVAIGMYARTYQRFVIPLLPYLACLAAYAVWRASSRFRPVAVVAVVALLVGPQVAVAVKLDAIRRAPDTATLAARWLEENLEPGADRILILPTFELPLVTSGEGLEGALRPWFVYQQSLRPEDLPGPAWNLIEMPMSPDSLREEARRDPVGYLRELRADYAIVEPYPLDRPPLVLGAICGGLREVADRVARISPDPEGSDEDLPITYQDDSFPRKLFWFGRVLRARRAGPVLEIWKFRKER